MEFEKIIVNCNNCEYSRDELSDFTDEYGTTKVYVVEGEDENLYYWNSSNAEAPRHNMALAYITEELIAENDGGTINDGWNEIMYEIK